DKTKNQSKLPTRIQGNMLYPAPAGAPDGGGRTRGRRKRNPQIPQKNATPRENAGLVAYDALREIRELRE
ncbi:MAG: hypothetical protein KDA46_13825, partial [Parvularculaceae bacterium]|nr:hypothetical protein [Parvularculaceae bacterium]